MSLVGELMLVNKVGSRGKHYRKSLVLILFVSGIPGLIIGAIVYWGIGGRIESELNQLHTRQIQQRVSSINDQLANLELMLSHWAFDPKFDYSLLNHDFVKDYERTRDITKTLLVMQGSNTLMKRVELFLHDDRSTLFNPEYAVLDQASIINSYDQLLSTKQLTYWREWAFDPAQPEQKDLVLVHKIPGGSTEPFGAIILRLDSVKSSSLLKTTMPYKEGEAFLIDEQGQLVASAGGQTELTPFMKGLQENIRLQQTGEDSFFYEWNGVMYTVSHGTFPRIGTNWTFVSAAPISNITAPVVFISKLILIASVFVLLLASAMAWFASRRIYSPVDQLVRAFLGNREGAGQDHQDEFKLIEREWQYLNRESKELQTRLERQLPHVKESYLLQLIQGYLGAYSEDDLLERMRHYHWDVEDQQFLILYIQLTGFARLEGRFSQGDEGLVTFAAVNIIEELADKRFSQADVMNFHDLTMGLLLMVPRDRTYVEDLQALSEELTQAINQLLKMRVTITFSRPTPLISEIPRLFEEARQAVSYRIFENENQIIDMEQSNYAEDASELRYPFALERELIQAMRTGKKDEAEEHLRAFLETLSGDGAKEIDVQQGMLHLLGSIQHAILISGINPNRMFKGANMYELLSQIREPEQMLHWFRDRIVSPYLNELEERTGAQVKKMVEQAMVYLQNNYMKDISLDSCADHTGTNLYFLSKSFKQVTGKNFIDYLTEIRMEQAKELLRDTEQKINDVAESVGYQHSYFNRIFKKQEGITPSQYREMSRGE
jgi:AraC-like DNA-binding protein